MSVNKEFKKENLDFYLKELAREYKKLNNRGIKIEIILVGGAAILANYSFRDMTLDIDAVIDKGYRLKDAIYAVADKYGLRMEWINNDFMKTASYSHKLRQYSVYYKTFCNCIEVRTVKAEYLIAMKLVASRKYKFDLSDILGIINEQKEIGEPIVFQKVDKAVNDLYGSWDGIDKEMIEFLNKALCNENIDKIYRKIRNAEKENKEMIVEIDKSYPNLVKENSINEIIASAKKRKEKKD